MEQQMDIKKLIGEVMKETGTLTSAYIKELLEENNKLKEKVKDLEEENHTLATNNKALNDLWDKRDDYKEKLKKENKKLKEEAKLSEEVAKEEEKLRNSYKKRVEQLEKRPLKYNRIKKKYDEWKQTLIDFWEWDLDYDSDEDCYNTWGDNWGTNFVGLEELGMKQYEMKNKYDDGTRMVWERPKKEHVIKYFKDLETSNSFKK